MVAMRKMEWRLEGGQRGLIWTELRVLNFSITLGTPFLANNRNVLLSCGMVGSRHSNERMVFLRVSGGKEEKLVGADCKEDIGVGHTKHSLRGQEPTATTFA